MSSWYTGRIVNFHDYSSDGDAFALARRQGDRIEITISSLKNGDVLVSLSREDASRVAELIRGASEGPYILHDPEEGR